MFHPRKLIVLCLIFPLLVGLACRQSAQDPTTTPADEPQDMIEAPSPESLVEDAPTPDSEAITPGVSDLVILEETWMRQEDSIFAAFHLSNPNPNILFEDVDFSIALYDAGGNKIDEQTISSAWVFPGQSFWLTNDTYIGDENLVVDHVTISWDIRDNQPGGVFDNPFSSLTARYWFNDGYPMATGIIRNSHPDTYLDIRVNVICFNLAGEVVGGAYTDLNFIPGSDQMGFSSHLYNIGDVVAIEIYPMFSENKEKLQGTEFWANIAILGEHFYEGDFGFIMGGVIIENQTDQVLENSYLYSSFYDDAGNITTTGSQYIDILLPGSTLGISPWIYSPPSESNTTAYDILVLPGEILESYELSSNPFVVNDAWVTGEFDSEITVHFTNTYNKSVSEVDVYVLLYNANGQIIGGGQAWHSEPIPASASSEIDVWVDYASFELIDTMDVWVVPNNWTVFD